MDALEDGRVKTRTHGARQPLLMPKPRLMDLATPGVCARQRVARF